MRSVVRFLDKDSSGTIDVGEIDEAVRDFRELSRDTPSLGTGPMTVIDSEEIDRLARRTFADIVVKHSSSSIGDNSNSNSDSSKAVGYSTSVEGQDDVEFRPPVATAAAAAEVAAGVAEGGEGVGDGGNGGGQQPPQETVSVSEISVAFDEAFRQFKADGEGQHSITAMHHPGTQQPSTDTQHAQVKHP